MHMRLTDMNDRAILFERTIPHNFHTPVGIEDETITFDHAIGTASLREIWFEGVHLSFRSSQLNREVSVHFETDMPVIEMHFGLEGSPHSAMVNNQHFLMIKPREHNILYMPGFEGYLKTGREGVYHEVLEVHFTEQYFKRFTNTPYTLLSNFAEQVDRKKIVKMSRQDRPITAQMNSILNDIIHCSREGIFKRLYLEAKILELLLLQIEQFEHADVAKEPRYLKPYDVDKIYHAKFLLEKHRDNPYSLIELAQEVGLNDFKLKKGFKETFGNTVFGYLHDLRMEEARRLLLDCQKPIQEIAHYCGYEHAQHFTRSFKKKFGVTPGGMRDNK